MMRDNDDYKICKINGHTVKAYIPVGSSPYDTLLKFGDYEGYYVLLVEVIESSSLAKGTIHNLAFKADDFEFLPNQQDIQDSEWYTMYDG